MMPEQPISALTPFEIGYICGLVVGEGSFTGDRQKPCLNMKLHATDPEPLNFLFAKLGGHLYGPYIHANRHYRVWRLKDLSLKAALPLFQEHLPPSRKRKQFIAWRLKYNLFEPGESCLPETSDAHPSPAVSTATT